MKSDFQSNDDFRDWRASYYRAKTGHALDADAQQLYGDTTLRSLGRRIWYLVELKAQNPNLYRLRIQEIRNDEMLWALATAHRDAEDLADITEAERIKTRLKELALKQVDLKLRVRAEELAAMSSALDRLRNEVMMDLERRQAKADELVERLLSGKMSHQMQHRKNEIRKLMDASPDDVVPNGQDSPKQR